MGKGPPKNHWEKRTLKNARTFFFIILPTVQSFRQPELCWFSLKVCVVICLSCYEFQEGAFYFIFLVVFFQFSKGLSRKEGQYFMRSGILVLKKKIFEVLPHSLSSAPV